LAHVKAQLTQLLGQAVTEAQRVGLLPPLAGTEITLERPPKPEHGDYASSVALKLARAARMNPLRIAESLVRVLPRADCLARVEVAPPGFINFTLDDGWLASKVEAILEAGPTFGCVDLGQGARVQVEFVSANPTGPLHAGAGRGAALGDALANILAAAGYRVEREYYINDAGSRMDAFYQSVYARYLQAFGLPAAVPEEGYQGQYIAALAQEIKAEFGDAFLHRPPAEAVAQLGPIALAKMVARAKEDLALMGVRFDNWFSEQSLYDDGAVQGTIALLRERGFVAEREGAVWFVSSALGEDKDNVLVRSNGVPTYFASDIAYHYDKFIRRNYDLVLNLWGADHQGHVARMKAAAGALGVSPERLIIIIHQMVTMRRGEEVVRLSKRTGDLITLREVLEEVGPDACRFFYLSRAAESQMDFDLELAKRQSAENPVYYVQYAHARIASILRYAEGRVSGDGDVRLLRTPPELALIRKMLLLPELVEEGARQLAPHPLPYYAQELAAIFHQFYKHCRVVSKDLELSRARLKLVRAAKIVLANTLHLMGISAPERM